MQYHMSFATSDDNPLGGEHKHCRVDDAIGVSLYPLGVSVFKSRAQRQ